jgi:hypothetical protein
VQVTAKEHAFRRSEVIMKPTADPAAVRGLPESALPPEQQLAMPASAPPAPWECHARAVLWVQRASRPRFDWLGAATGLAVAGFVEYLDSPVGRYHEVLAGSLVRTGLIPRVQVPFIAVDSLASVAGGRINWALPKTMASFQTDLEAGSARAEGEGWSVTVQPVRPGLGFRLRLPIRLRFSAIGPLGNYRTSLRASGRIVRVRTAVDGETLTGWLRSGTHLAVVLTGRLRIQPPSGS